MKYAEWYHRCPYGKWTCRDGREVIFNRAYWPILERRLGEAAKPVPGANEWVKNIVRQDYYFHDGTTPWGAEYGVPYRTRRKTLAVVNAVLAEWGFPQLDPPPRRPRWKPGQELEVYTLDDIPRKPRVNPYEAAP